MAITFRQLIIFEKVANCGHVTQASQEVGLTQSAVSMAVAELERFAGTPLFHRHGRKLILNDRGRHVLPMAREVLAQIRAIEQFLEESAGGPVGVLNVGASTTIANYILPSIIGEFSRRYSEAKALLHVGNAQQIEISLENGDLDVGIIEGISHIQSLTSNPWRRDELVVVVGGNHEWAMLRNVTQDRLAEAEWIMREKGSGTREIFEAAMDKRGVSFSIALELGHTEAIKKAAEAGLGVGCLSRMAVQRELDHGWLVEIATPLDLRRTLVILTRKKDHETVLLKTFLQLLKQTGDFD